MLAAMREPADQRSRPARCLSNHSDMWMGDDAHNWGQVRTANVRGAVVNRRSLFANSSGDDDIAEKFRRHIEKRDRAIGTQRIGALNKLFSDRYGGREGYVFPDDDAGAEDLEILLQHYRTTNPLAMRRIIKLRAPWMSEAEAAQLLEKVETYPRRWRAETLGRLLNFTGDEWKRLRLRTIAPVDMTDDERRKFSTQLNTEKRRLRRLAKGMKTRAEWLEENNRTKPWEELGISKATYYRRRSRNVPETPPNDHETGLAAIKI
jgi:hypothetical protein